MKHISRAFIAIILSLLTATLLPLQVFAETPDYISEVKVYEGSCKNAEKEGFAVLADENGKAVDLNEGSGSTGTGAKGNKAVYLGYKTTKKRSEAITDLALMNMKGGYDCAEYDKLMAGQMSQQIIPFVENFLAAINEYRDNYHSDTAANKERAQYFHDMLNKLTDDDCGGAGLGDLFLNETVYEMAKPQYEALSDKEKENISFYDINNKVRDSLPEAEKNKHADILTIVAQSNGQATLMINNLLTRATDTNEDTWTERFEGTAYDDLLALVEGSPSDKVKKLAKMYDDDAQTVLKSVSEFQEDLKGYDDALEIVNKTDYEALTKTINEFCKIDKSATPEEFQKAFDEYTKAQTALSDFYKAAETVGIYKYLEDTDYNDGTLLDFFLMSEEEFEDDITALYPLVASLTEGQRAGLDFVTLKEMFAMALTDLDAYSRHKLDSFEPVSIYEGVDRAIYEKGGVALTSDAFRADAMSKVYEQGSKGGLSGLQIALIVIASVSAVAAITSGVISGYMFKTARYWRNYANYAMNQTPGTEVANFKLAEFYNNREYGSYISRGNARDLSNNAAEISATKGRIWAGLSAGLTVTMIVLSAVTVYLSYKDMKAYYNVDFTPVPHYMVDAKDITGYNEKGEKIVLKNQSAYYKAVESNRKKGDDYFKEIDVCADMNGCVNPQWLALYEARNEAENPIIADSLKVVRGSSEVPQGYETGIHFFGEKAAFNLNSKLYCWNQKAKSIMVYYKTDKTAATATGSSFTTGTLILAAGGGLLAGAAITAIGMTAAKKRRKNQTSAA